MSDATPVLCETCDRSARWANHRQCFGCLYHHVKPCDYVPKLATHTDLATALAEVRRYKAEWEQAHPWWELMPDYQRIWEDSAAPSKYADRETGIGRKLVWARFKVERKHPRGRRVNPWLDALLHEPLLHEPLDVLVALECGLVHI
jgi:hypothetical protein